MDPQGSVVPGATVVVHADATGQEKSIKTTGDGQYRVQYLVPGTYTVTVTASGFAPSVRSGIQLALSQQIHLDVSVSLGSTQQTVEVSAGQAVLQTESATLGTTVDTNRTVNLPLNGRKFNDLGQPLVFDGRVDHCIEQRPRRLGSRAGGWSGDDEQSLGLRK
jgi:hypothetical protein